MTNNILGAFVTGVMRLVGERFVFVVFFFFCLLLGEYTLGADAS